MLTPLSSDPWFDEVTVRLAPIYIEQAHTGMWDAEAHVVFGRKGTRLLTTMYKDMFNAIDALPNIAAMFAPGRPARDETKTTHLCFQPGCSRRWEIMVKYISIVGPDGAPMYRAFCLQHARRGELNPHDRDSKYRIEAGHVPERVCTSPSGGGNILRLFPNRDAR